MGNTVVSRKCTKGPDMDISIMKKFSSSFMFKNVEIKITSDDPFKVKTEVLANPTF